MAIFIFIIGLIFGSFMNVLVRRVPHGESIIAPGSHCPQCNAPIKWYSNIPVVSYILQKGRCKDCGDKISIMYPITELTTAIVFCLIFLNYGSTILTIKYCSFAFLMLSAAFTDIYTSREGSFESGMVPDIYTIGGVFLGYIWAFFTPPGLVGALAGSGAGFFIIAITAMLYKIVRKQEGIGEGDALMLAAAGSFLGLEALPFVLLLSALTGIFAGIIVVARTRNIRYKIPFAPAIAFASLVWLFTTSFA